MTTFRQDWFEENPLVGILRGFAAPDVEALVAASIRGGLRNLEITMNSPDAGSLIRLAARLGGGQLNIGAGTVLHEATLRAALEAGAGFIVTPVVNETVIRHCVRHGIPVFPGALTPTEIVRAWDLGATMVKVFPADQLGPGYLRNIKAPLPHIRLMPTGGVSLETLDDYVQAGADAAGLGSPLFQPRRVREKDWNWVEAQCRAFGEAWKEAAQRKPRGSE